MRLKSVTLQNWCQFREKQIEFADGLTAIIGPNGAGKSNVMGCVYWLLTGDNPNEGKLEENISQFAQADEPAGGTLTIEHDAGLVEIKRFLLPASAKAALSINGKQVCRGERVVTAKVQELFGMDAKMLRRFVIVAQGDIFGFLAEDPAERAKAFQKLFDTAKCEKIYTDLGKALAGITVRDFSNDLQQVTNDIVHWETAVAGMQQQVNAEPSVAKMAADEAEWRSIAEIRAETKRQCEQRMAVGQQLGALTARVMETRSRALQHEQELQQLQTILQEGRVAADQARAALAGWDNYHQLVRNRTALQQEQQRIEHLLAATKAPALPLEPAMPAPLAVHPLEAFDTVAGSNQLCSLNDEIARLQAVLQQFDGTGLANCPTCQTPVANLGPLLEDYRRQIPVLQTGAHLLVDQINGANEAKRARDRQERIEQAYIHEVTTHRQRVDEAVARHQQWVQEQQAALARVSQQLAATPEPTMQAGSPDEARQAISTVAEYELRIKNLEPVVRAYGEQLAAENSQIELLQQQCTQLDSQLYTSLASQPAYAELPGLVAALDQQIAHALENSRVIRELISQRQRTEGQLASATTALEQCRSRLAQLQAAQQADEINREWSLQLEQYRSVFHHSGVPKFVSHENLQNLQLAVNNVLGIFDSDFRVVADQGLSFTARFTDGRQQPARRLSGGQKVVLALAFRVAVNSVFATAAGLLALDEPTAWLDEHHIKAFGPVLDRLRGLAASSGLQCIFVTHERGLAPLFEKVVQV